MSVFSGNEGDKDVTVKWVSESASSGVTRGPTEWNREPKLHLISSALPLSTPHWEKTVHCSAVPNSCIEFVLSFFFQSEVHYREHPRLQPQPRTLSRTRSSDARAGVSRSFKFPLSKSPLTRREHNAVFASQICFPAPTTIYLSLVAGSTPDTRHSLPSVQFRSRCDLDCITFAFSYCILRCTAASPICGLVLVVVSAGAAFFGRRSGLQPAVKNNYFVNRKHQKTENVNISHAIHFHFFQRSVENLLVRLHELCRENRRSLKRKSNPFELHTLWL